MRAIVAIAAVALVVLGGAAALLVGWPERQPKQTTQAPRATRVMIVGDDVDPSLLPHTHPMFEAVLVAVENGLRNSGFAVADGRAVSPIAPGDEHARRSDAEIL